LPAASRLSSRPSCQTLGPASQMHSSFVRRWHRLAHRLPRRLRWAVRLRGRRTYRLPRKAWRCSSVAVRLAKESPHSSRSSRRRCSSCFASGPPRWSLRVRLAFRRCSGKVRPSTSQVGSNAVQCQSIAGIGLFTCGTARQGRVSASAVLYPARPNYSIEGTSCQPLRGRQAAPHVKR
jgi:hypothetical protein